MPWIPNGAAIRARREQCSLSLAALEEKSQVTEKTIRRLEGGQKTIQEGTLKLLAAALDCKPEQLAEWRTDSENDDLNRRTLHPIEPDDPLPTERVRDAWKRQRRINHAAIELAKERRIRAEAPELTALVIQHCVTAFRAQDKQFYRLTGRVEAQAALSEIEQFALGCHLGVGARFLVMSTEDNQDPQRVTVVSTRTEHTRQLQSALGRAEPVSLLLRVTVVHTDADHATASKEDRPIEAGYFRKNWRGFSVFGSDQLVVWALVIDSEEPPQALVEAAARHAKEWE